MGKKYDLAVLERQFFDVVTILNKAGLLYHLEGGTLLGIVREQRILPWDHDTDISIMRPDLEKLRKLLPAITRAGWRISTRNYEVKPPYTAVGDCRLIKIRDRKFFFCAGNHTLDIFIKFELGEYVYWSAARHVMRVPAHYYRGYETIKWRGLDLKVPVDYRGYLTEKYGDWSVPVKSWVCGNEKTVFIPRQC